MCLQFFLEWRQLFWSTTAEKIAEAFAGVVPVLEALERAFRERSKGKPFFGGDAIGLVEADRLAAPDELLLPLDMLLLYMSALETSLPCCLPRDVFPSTANRRRRERSVRRVLLGPRSTP